MREIKFRAWDTKQKKMQDDGTVRFNGEFYIPDYDDYSKRHPRFYMTDDCILMQFTGLKDKNEKEIYEFDILEQVLHYPEDSITGRKFNNFNLVGVVYFDRKLGGYYITIDINEGGDHEQICQEATVKDYEVIGNVFENYSLLNE